MVMRIILFSYYPIMLVIFASALMSCAKKTVEPVKYHYAVVKGTYYCSSDKIKDTAFQKKILNQRYEDVRAAAVDVLSQRGAILEIEEKDNHTTFVSAFGQLGTFYNALIAFHIVTYNRRLTVVTASWIDPQNLQCTEIITDRRTLTESSIEPLTPLEQRQALALMVGTEFFMQLSTQLEGPLKWHKKFW